MVEALVKVEPMRWLLEAVKQAHFRQRLVKLEALKLC